MPVAIRWTTHILPLWLVRSKKQQQVLCSSLSVLPLCEHRASTATLELTINHCSVYGIFVAQLYYYSLNYPNDSRSLRGYVWFVA